MPKNISGKQQAWQFMTRFEIPNFDTDDNYLVRWRLIQTPWFGIYLHKIGTPDSRSTLHDHPWNFLAVVLRGGYVERRLNTKTMQVNEHHRIRFLNRMRTHDFHSIMQLARMPTWTLVFVGIRRRTWGYLEHPSLNQWEWTEFDKHRHGAEFDAALERRKHG